MEGRVSELERRVEGIGKEMQESMRRLDDRMLELMERLEKANQEGRNRSNDDAENSGNSGNARTEERMRRLEVPYFTGEDSYGWIYRAERYFQVNRIPEPEKVMAAAICLEGRALNWFQWWEPRTTWITWNSFRSALLQRFQLSSMGNPYEALLSLKQTGTMAEYRENFELMSAPLRHADDEVLKAAFMNGLSDAVKAEVRLHSMDDLGDLMTLAQRVEEKNQMLGRVAPNQSRFGHWSGSGMPNFNRPALSAKLPNLWEGNGPGPKGNISSAAQNGVHGIRTFQMGSGRGTTHMSNAGTSASGVGSGGGAGAEGFRRGSRYKRLTQEELQDKLKRNVCFRCDAPFSHDHVCQNQHLHVLVLSPDDNAEEPEEEQGIIEENTGDLALKLSLNSIAGMTSKKSLKLWGEIGGKKVVVLIDSGASHNFLSRDLVDELQLPIEGTKQYSVEVGDGHRIQSRGVCRAVQLEIPNLVIVQDFFIFDLGGADVVLGFEWLEELGDIWANFKELTLKVKSQGKTVEIKGDPSLSRSKATLKALVKALRSGGEGYYVEYGAITLVMTEEKEIASNIQEVL